MAANGDAAAYGLREAGNSVLGSLARIAGFDQRIVSPQFARTGPTNR